ncbi:hypothetical protein G6O67_002299 [Ophiocordyceps sinensis]|uniref:Zinc finger containing protein n=1 Tax=Ophiocordyceps sinensis TaxID=72228 RepID=A0A8H4V7C7_9HYPO|nr:hypothetical protein G6O67_002299 [Ophiocordyceps sinensis]
MSHSKRNTSRPVFTSHERALAKSDWATSSARLNRDSFLPFGSCGLCLGIAREPVACLRGDIFCRECALANVLAQKKEMKRADRARREAKQEAEQARAMEDDEERDRAIRDFELTQAGLSSANKRSKSAPKSTPNVQDEPSSALVLVGWKRKFALDEDQVSHIAREDKTRARKAIEEEKAAKPTLPSFWTPSLTPDVQDSLVTVHFNEDVGEPNETNRYTCPSCLKTLSNSSKPVMAEHY